MNKAILAVVLVIGFAGLAYAGFGSGNGSWRYKMTVEVETPEGIKTGSAVREVTVHSGLRLLPEQGPEVKVKGEAVVVDLGKRGMLFALVSGDSSSEISAETFYPERAWLKPEGVRYMSGLRTGLKVLEPSQYPILVRFSDLTDPKTIEAVSQDNDNEMPYQYGGIKKRSGDIFGKGVNIKKITLEMTQEKVTGGIEKILTWLPSYYNKRLDGNRYGLAGRSKLPLANSLSAGFFSTGMM